MEWENVSMVSDDFTWTDEFDDFDDANHNLDRRHHPAPTTSSAAASFAFSSPVTMGRVSPKESQFSPSRQYRNDKVQLIGNFNQHDVLLGVKGSGEQQYDSLFPGNKSYREHLTCLVPLLVPDIDRKMYSQRNNDVEIGSSIPSNPVIRQALEYVWSVGGQFYLLEPNDTNTVKNKHLSKNHSHGGDNDKNSSCCRRILKMSNAAAALYVRQDLFNVKKQLNRRRNSRIKWYKKSKKYNKKETADIGSGTPGTVISKKQTTKAKPTYGQKRWSSKSKTKKTKAFKRNKKMEDNHPNILNK